MFCQSATSALYPMTAEIYYPLVDQNAYGQVTKRWVLDRTVVCFFGPASAGAKEDLVANANITFDNVLLGRVPEDLTQSTRNSVNSFTNIVITNIKDSYGNIVYNESSGPRAGKATVYEIASFTPIVGAFRKTEYFKTVIRRSENQAVDL